MNQQLYVADCIPPKNEFAKAALIDVEYDDSLIERCPNCGSCVSGSYWKAPREVVLTSRNAPDFLYTLCDTAPFVISERALEMIRQEGLTGIKAAEKIEKVRFQRKSKKETLIPTYYHIELKRSKMTIDHSRSVIHYGPYRGRKACPLCRQVPCTYDFFRSLTLCEDGNEAYDIFHIYELGSTAFVSERFVKMCEKYSLTNLHFKPTQTYGRELAEYFLDGNENA